MKKIVVKCPECGKTMQMVGGRRIYPITADRVGYEHHFSCEEHGYFAVEDTNLNDD